MKYLKIVFTIIITLAFVLGFGSLGYTLLTAKTSLHPIAIAVVVSAILSFICSTIVDSIKRIQGWLKDGENDANHIDDVADFDCAVDSPSESFILPSGYVFSRSSIVNSQKITHCLTWHRNRKYIDIIGLGLFAIIWNGGILFKVIDKINILSVTDFLFMLSGFLFIFYYLIFLFGKNIVAYDSDSAIYRKRLFFITYYKRVIVRQTNEIFELVYGKYDGSFAKIKISEKTLLLSQDYDFLEYLTNELNKK